MAPRTLSSSWRQLEKLAHAYIIADETQKKDCREALDDLIERVNKSKIGSALATLFVNSFDGFDESGVVFSGSDGLGCYPEWTVCYDPGTDQFALNPVAIVTFVDECEVASKALERSNTRLDDLDDDDQKLLPVRLQTCLSELSKLPSQLLLFLQLLKAVGQVLKVTQVEKRGGGKYEIDDERYMTLMWAFKQLERIYRELKGISLRSEYLMLWFESDWFTGDR